MRIPQNPETAPPAFKAWLTGAEIHEENLAGVGDTLRCAYAIVAEVRKNGPHHLWRQRPLEKSPDLRARAPGSVVEIHYTCLPLEAIVAYEARRKTQLGVSQPRDRRLARLGTSVLAVSQGGQLRALILQRLAADPRMAVAAVRDRCIERFGLDIVVIAQGLPALVPMPPLRTFQAFVKTLRETGAADVGA